MKKEYTARRVLLAKRNAPQIGNFIFRNHLTAGCHWRSLVVIDDRQANLEWGRTSAACH